MIDLDEFKSRVNSFPHWGNFDYLWEWKIRVESNGANHILDANHREETYCRLREILPKLQTYRMGDSTDPLEILRDSLRNIPEAYDQIRRYTLLEFDEVPRESLEIIWHELGRVKERDGNRNDHGHYYIIAVCKPLLLMWGQTLGFDTKVRKHCSQSYGVPRYSHRWNLELWLSVMEEFSGYLNENVGCVEAIKAESERRYGANFLVPYGRFLDIFYWMGS